MLSIGDYVEYTPDTTSNYSILSTYSGYSSEQSIPQEKLNWQILSINNDGTVELISENRTTKYIVLQGALGYNNGVYLLNDIGKQLYSNNTLGAIGRSINIEDIEKNYSELGKTYKNNNTGNAKSFSSCNYPVLYAQENGSGINTTVTKTDGINGSYNSNLMLEKSSYASSLTATY